MQNLAKEGVYLIEGIAKGETGKKFYLAFQDVVLEYGDLKRIKKAIQELAKKSKLELVKYLDELAEFVPKSGLFSYGTTNASKRAIAFRKTLGKSAKHNGNIAIVEYIDEAPPIDWTANR